MWNEKRICMSEEMVFQISVPTDEEGFVLLECPLCGELFKLNPSDYQDDRDRKSVV